MCESLKVSIVDTNYEAKTVKIVLFLNFDHVCSFCNQLIQTLNLTTIYHVFKTKQSDSKERPFVILT